jgi:SAM-dependent methyltransferase
MGIDLSPQQIALARQRGLENTVVADAMTFLKQRTGTYALINASSILEHLTRPELFHLLDLTVAALRPGGLLFGVVPNAKSFLGSHVRYGDITHELCFTPESLVQIFQIVGLRPIALLEHGPIVHGVISAVRWSIWQCLRAMMWTAFVAEGADYQNRVYTQNIMFVAEKA